MKIRKLKKKKEIKKLKLATGVPELEAAFESNLWPCRGHPNNPTLLYKPSWSSGSGGAVT